MRPPVTPDDRVHIDEADAAAVLDLSNAVYNQMLRLLAQAYARSDGGAEGKRRLVDGAMTLMGIFSSLGRLLASLPASPRHPGVHAGVSFTTLRAAAPLCETESEWRTIAERLAELAMGARGVAMQTAGARQVAERLHQLAGKFS